MLCPLVHAMGVRSRQTPTHKASWAIPGARCNHTNPAVAMGRASQSLVVICQTGVGRVYCKGFGLQNGSSVEIDDPRRMRAASTFVATNNRGQYSFSPTALTITQRSA